VLVGAEKKKEKGEHETGESDFLKEKFSEIRKQGSKTKKDMGEEKRSWRNNPRGAV